MATATISELPSPLTAIRGAIQRVCQRYPIAKMEIFGSQATGTAQMGSDMDLLVEFLPNSQAGLVEMGALREDLEQQLGCRVELLSRPAVERSQNSYRRRSILANPLTLYAR